MRRNRSVFSILIQTGLAALFLVATASAQPESVTLRYAFAAGQTLTVVQEEVSTETTENLLEQSRAQGTTSKEMAQTWDVQSVTPEGDATISMKFSTLTFRRSLAPGVDFVLDVHRPVVQTNPVLSELGEQGVSIIETLETVRALIADLYLRRTFEFVVSNLGDVKSVTGFDEAFDAFRLKLEPLIPDKAQRAQLDISIEGLFGESAMRQVLALTLFAGLPSRRVSVGEEWSDSTEFIFASLRLPVRRNYKLARFSGQGSRSSIDGRIVFERPASTEELEFRVPKNTLLARIDLDPASGTVLKQSYEGDIDIEMFGRQPPNMRKLLQVSSKIKGSIRIETAQ